MNMRKHLGFVLICIGIFVTPETMRTGILNTQWALINVISWAGILLLMSRYWHSGKITLSSPTRPGMANPLWVIALLVLFIASCLSNSHMAGTDILKYAYALIFPLLILYVKVPDSTAEAYFNFFTRCLTACCTLMVACGLLDLLFGAGIGKAIARLTGLSSLYYLSNVGRMVSYMGHSLLSTEILLMCFLFNALRRLYKGSEPIWFTAYYCTICLIGIGLCASKTGLVLLAMAFLLLCVGKNKWKYVLVAIGGIYLAYQFGFFNTVLQRFAEGLLKGDLTTGRNTALKLLLQTGSLRFKFFSGFAGTELTTSMIAALEYPPLRWAYLFGVWFSIIMCVVLFVKPIIKCLRAGAGPVLWSLIVLMIDVNSYNGITTQKDHMLIYCVAVFILLNMARIWRNRNENMPTDAKPVYPRRNPARRHDDIE